MKMKNKFPYLDENVFFDFPSVESATPEGIVAAGGNLSPGMLLSAYSQGLFPWFNRHDPVLWWSPDPRFVLFPEKLHISRSLAKLFKKEAFRVEFNSSFNEIIRGCRNAYRPGQGGTWITDEMEEAYKKLFGLGYVYCAAVREPGNTDLAGGIYGVKIGRCYFGESMFFNVENASKYGFVLMVEKLAEEGVEMIDCQVETEHLRRFGAGMIPRNVFINKVKELIND